MREYTTDGLVKLSIVPGLIGPILYAYGVLSARLRLLPAVNIPNQVIVPLLFGAGGLALLLAIIGLIRILRWHRRGVILGIVGILLGLFDVLLGLALIAVSQIQVLPGNQPFF